jgi:hypothetical protein
MKNVKIINKIMVLIVANFAMLNLPGSMSFASDVGVTGAQFLKIGTGARPMGMAGAFSAVADDAYAAYWNPAGFAQLQKPELATTYLRYFEDINYGYMGYAMPYRTWGVFGIGASYLTLGGIEGRTGDSEIPDRKFKADDICLTLSYARKDVAPTVVPGLSAGVNLKLISQKIDAETAQTAALDIAGLYQTAMEPLTIALNIQNIGPGQKFVEERDPLPLNLKLGAAYRLFNNQLTIAADVDQYLIDQKLYAGIGTEYWLMHMIGIRAGYRYGYHTDSLGNLVGLAAGLSFRAFNFQLDYAFVPFGDLGDTHRFSFSIKF